MSWLGLLRIRVRAHHLDELLAEGRNPALDELLAARAAQLAQPSSRARLAAALRDALSSIDRFPGWFTPQAPVNRDAVDACRGEIDDLAQALVKLEEPRVRGIAIAWGLLTDGAGPLYLRDQTDRLRNTLLTARRAL
jgi:hypothetical protein